MNKKLLALSVVGIVLITIAAAVGFHAYASARAADEPTRLVAVARDVHDNTLTWNVTDKPQQVRQLYDYILTGSPPNPYQSQTGQSVFITCDGMQLAIYTLTFIDAKGATLLTATANEGGSCESIIYQRPGQARQGHAADGHFWLLLADALRT